MSDCLPHASEWSANTRYLMLTDHLEALEHHLEHLKNAHSEGFPSLVAAIPHLHEINERCLEAQVLIKLLQHDPPVLDQNLKSRGTQDV